MMLGDNNTLMGDFIIERKDAVMVVWGVIIVHRYFVVGR